MKNFLILFFSILAITGGSVNGQQNKRVAQTQHQQIDQIYKMFSKAYSLKNADILKHLYTQDCVYISPDKEVGIENNEDVYNGFREMFEGAKADEKDLEIKFKFVTREVNGDMAIDAGYYKLSRSKGKKDKTYSHGKFLIILKKGEDNIWKIFADSYSACAAEFYENADDN